MRVLVVDDNPNHRENLADLLTGEGHNVWASPGAFEAGRLAESFVAVPDVLLLDYFLPGSDGLTLLRALRSRPGWEAVPAVLLTADPEVQVTEPRTVTLTKPADVERVQAAIRLAKGI